MSGVPTGNTPTVFALAASGGDVYAGGFFGTAGGIPAANIAKWNGSSWSELGSGMDNIVYALAVSGSKRSAQYPELPTISEFYPGFENSIWLGLFAPASVPEPILKKLREEIRRALESADLKERFNHAGGLEPLVLPPDEFVALIRRDYEKYAKVVKDLGVKVD